MKRFLALLLCLTMVFSVAACGKNNGSTDTTAPESTSSETNSNQTVIENKNKYPFTVTDQAGRTVTIEKEPEKIVSGYYISTSALIALGLEDNLVGIEAKADKREIYKLSAPELIDLPSVGTAKEFDLEGCIALEPDLVILPLKLQNVAESLEALDIDVIFVNPENSELLTGMLAILGGATNTTNNAGAIMQFTYDTEQDISKALEGTEAPTVYLAGNSSMLSTAGSAMYQSAMIDIAGGKNVAADITDTYWVEIDYEQLLTWDPEYIILASDATYTVEDVLADPNLANCKAVRENKVYQMPGDAEAWDSPIPGGILGSAWLASVLHAEEYTAEDAAKVIDNFYEKFYGFKYSEK